MVWHKCCHTLNRVSAIWLIQVGKAENNLKNSNYNFTVEKSHILSDEFPFTHFDPIEHLADHPESSVLASHHVLLQTVHFSQDEGVKRHHDKQDGEPGKHGVADGLVQEVECQDDLEGAGPQGKQVRDEDVDVVSIHRHQVDYLTNCGVLLGLAVHC